MVDGLKFEVPGELIREQYLKKAATWRAKAAAKEDSTSSNVWGTLTAEEASEKAVWHAERNQRLAKMIRPSESYLLTITELQTLGL